MQQVLHDRVVKTVPTVCYYGSEMLTLGSKSVGNSGAIYELVLRWNRVLYRGRENIKAKLLQIQIMGLPKKLH